MPSLMLGNGSSLVDRPMFGSYSECSLRGLNIGLSLWAKIRTFVVVVCMEMRKKWSECLLFYVY